MTRTCPGVRRYGRIRADGFCLWVAGGLLVAACATVPAAPQRTEQREDPLSPTKRMLIVAHRGASGLVEHGNTLEAFEKAIEVGAPMMELDVRRTRDGQLVVHHDSDVDEVPLHALSYPELIDRTRGHGYRAPLLQEVVDLAAANNTPVVAFTGIRRPPAKG